ncbi:MAG: glycolate oxidase subunit GlcF [Amylibacter sp.]|nr:glycolate oxidase subunit GlcF [Amylibacter sp.]|tara:strand:- start:205 stop:1506 length:1302 start_codon:yes stop_codon:yes gene_type:complete
MQTNFTDAQLDDPKIARSNAVLRNCVHCGFCTATCPTYQILGDELDSPRGRIYLIKDMLENQRIPDKKVVKHVDRCLSCLACMTTCPSGVNYMHLVDHAREYIEDNYKRPLFDRIMRATLAQILPYDRRFRFAMKSAQLVKPLAPIFPSKIRNMVDFAPKKLPVPSLNDKPQVFLAEGARIKRVALMTGCAQKALDTDINDATIRLLRRHGCEVVVAQGAGCCGALTHHMGKAKQSHVSAAKNIKAWMTEINNGGLDAIVINTSGCGTTVKDYGHMFEGDILEEDAKTIGALAKDISEVMIELGLKNPSVPELRVAYHAACSLQHGQQIKTYPKTLLKDAGFTVMEPKDSHLCCGSAGTYNLMQPEISKQLKDRKVKTLDALTPDVISAGNIGCMMQIGSAIGVPVVHTAELLDWATGGPKPAKMSLDVIAAE